MAQTEQGKIALPEPGRYTRKAIDFPDRYDGIGKSDGGDVPRTTDPDAIDIFIVEEASISRDGRDIRGKVQSCNMSEARPASTTMVQWASAGWERDTSYDD